MVEPQDKPKSIVELSVGGVNYTTTLQTLTKDYESKLYRMFVNGEDLVKMDSGKYFIDRNGKYFEYILEYLRDPESDFRNFDAERTEQILKEAAYF